MNNIILAKTLSRLQITGSYKRTKIKGGAFLYVSENECSLVFEDCAWNYDAVERALNILGSVPKKNQLTRILQASTAKELLAVVNLAYDNLPITKVDVANKVLSKQMNKDYAMYMSTLREAINLLQRMD